MDEPTWLERTTIDAIHYDQLQRHGGRPGIKDENALESAIARPRQKWTYEVDADLFVLAAAYCFGLATNHAYTDGNKRVGFMAMYTFLGMNDWEIVAPEPEVVQLVLDVVARTRDEKALADWLREHVEPFID
ncbi:type II toxin-antitoxin system death-on-curing family toxin [soil metagenome]